MYSYFDPALIGAMPGDIINIDSGIEGVHIVSWNLAREAPETPPPDYNHLDIDPWVEGDIYRAYVFTIRVRNPDNIVFV